MCPTRIRDYPMKQFNFLTFIEPFLSYIDSGKLFRKPFSWLYLAFAALNALLPFYLLAKAIDSGILRQAPAKFIFAFIFAWLFVVIACWVGFQIWWNRKDKVLETSQEGADFPATPVIAHLIQTFGEWLGSIVAIVGFGVSLCAIIFLGSDAGELSYALGGFSSIAGLGVLGLVLNPIWGFMIMVGFRFFAEIFRALASIANNTKK